MGSGFGRKWDEDKLYIRPSEVDIETKAQLETRFGLRVSYWVVMYYKESDPDMIIEYLSEN
jgi:hypothetical protein